MTAKRMIWGIRVLFYGSLALAVFLLLPHGGKSKAETGPVTLFGHTARGDYVSVGVRDGRVFRIRTWVELRCLGGGTRASRVIAVASRGETFATHGDRVSVRATFPWDATREFTHHVRVDARREGARISGMVSDVVTATGRTEHVCSGKAAFNAHE
jgi:hypothetical protein